ncbi:hypothetical protein [Nocardioides montaniterrae]
MTSRLLIAVGIVVAVFGLVFSLQGFGALKGSPMTDTTTWSVLGPIIAVVGLGAVWLGLRRRP